MKALHHLKTHPLGKFEIFITKFLLLFVIFFSRESLYFGEPALNGGFIFNRIGPTTPIYTLRTFDDKYLVYDTVHKTFKLATSNDSNCIYELQCEKMSFIADHQYISNALKKTADDVDDSDSYSYGIHSYYSSDDDSDTGAWPVGGLKVPSPIRPLSPLPPACVDSDVEEMETTQPETEEIEAEKTTLPEMETKAQETAELPAMDTKEQETASRINKVTFSDTTTIFDDTPITFGEAPKKHPRVTIKSMAKTCAKTIKKTLQH